MPDSLAAAPSHRTIRTHFVRSGALVPLADGTLRAPIDLDAAATTPALQCVADAVGHLLGSYASVHRGSGFNSRLTSGAYEGAREAVRDFVGARDDDHVVFVRGTTEAANLLSHCLPRGAVVLAAEHEHHANLLPWRRHELRLVPLARSADELLSAFERHLRAGDVDLVAFTGASNVSGEILPVAELAALAREHGARSFLDAAQLAPHRALDIARDGVDHVALSGHKLYAPYGTGVLAGRPELLDAAEPWLHGGGASAHVDRGEVRWASGPQRHEAGSPNVPGAVALGVACDTLRALGFGAIEAHERSLARHLWHGLAEQPRVHRHTLFTDPLAPRVGVAAFTVDGWSAEDVAAALGREHGIGVRAGRFCAHMLVDGLTGTTMGAVRASLGLHTTHEDVAALLDALQALPHRAPHRRAAPFPAPADLPYRVAA